MNADLREIAEGVAASSLPEPEKVALQARARELRGRTEALESLPEGFSAILPLDDLYTRVYALHVPLSVHVAALDMPREYCTGSRGWTDCPERWGD